jgi:E3 ubiquitin-protein ligase EDD1
LLNGVGDIHVGTLISYTTFNDESSESGDKLLKFKRWLWSIVEKMSNVERQDLVSSIYLNFVWVVAGISGLT